MIKKMHYVLLIIFVIFTFTFWKFWAYSSFVPQLITIVSRNQTETDECTADNWMNEILEQFQPSIAYNQLVKHHLTNTLDTDLENESTASMLIITEPITLNQSFALWKKLASGSLYVQRVTTMQDIKNMGRYSELTQWP